MKQPAGMRRRWVTAIPLLLGLASAQPAGHVDGDPAQMASPARPPSSDTKAGAATLDDARDLIGDGRFIEPASLARDLLEQESVRSGPDSMEVAAVLDLVVEAERLAGMVKNEPTREAARRAIRIREVARGPEHPDVARSVNNLANLLAEAGDYVGAKPLYERVLSIQEKKLDPDDPLIARTLNNYANLISDMGDYSGSRPLYERSLRLKEKAYGPEDPQLISTLTGLGILLRLSGEYTEARRYCERAIHIAEGKLRPGHPRRAHTLVMLAGIFQETGDYAEARALLERARALQERELAPDHPDLAATLGDLANLLSEAGDLENARELYERALGIQGRSLEAESTYLVPILNSLGEIYLKQGKVEAARTHFERGLAILEREFGPDHPDVAYSFGTLAAVLEQKGELAAAKGLLERGLRIREQSLGPAHPLVAATLARLARVVAGSGDGSAAMDLAHRAESIGRQHLRLISRELPERQALRYASTRPSGLYLELELASRGSDAAWTRTGWDDLIRSRALVLDEMAARHRSALAAEDSAVQDLRTTLASERAKEAALLVRGLEGQDPTSYRRLLEEIRERKERLERALGERSLEYQRERSRADIGLPEVLEALPRDSALVAFALSHRGEGDRGMEAPRYVAFVVGQSIDLLHVVRLPAASEVDALVARWRAAVAVEPSPLQAVAHLQENEARRVGTDLRETIWDPVIRRVRGARQVFIVPDGVLNLVNFAALPAGEDRYLVETGPLLHYLSAESDIILDRSKPRRGSRLLAVGGPDFDGRPPGATITVGSGKAGHPGRNTYRGPRTSCEQRPALHFDPLPGARREAEEAAAVWVRRSQDRSGAVQSLEGAHATEERVKRLAPEFDVVHLATHAFSLSEDCLPAFAIRSAENPLLLSGLAFAGANRRTEPEIGIPAEDGILTAEELASIDLSRVAWMVLSGCETGLGKVHPGEGVLGLRRAVQVAGAATLIMSLWKAKDEPTRRWMGRLYERRLSGLSTAEAVRAASRDIIAASRVAGDSAHPFFWGAFVAAGDWR